SARCQLGKLSVWSSEDYKYVHFERLPTSVFDVQRDPDEIQ
ncbi:MAG: hypothetical protein ACI8VW_002130, partial [bacterium]